MMAQTILTLCDPHLAAGEELPAETWTVSMLAPGTRKVQSFAVDVCEVDAKPFAEMLAWLAEHGRHADAPPKLIEHPERRGIPGPKPKADAPAPGSFQCPGCDHVARTVGGLRSHVQTNHDGQTVAELDGTAKLPCPEKGCKRRFTAPQGVASHRRIVHGYSADE